MIPHQQACVRTRRRCVPSTGAAPGGGLGRLTSVPVRQTPPGAERAALACRAGRQRLSHANASASTRRPADAAHQVGTGRPGSGTRGRPSAVTQAEAAAAARQQACTYGGGARGIMRTGSPVAGGARSADCIRKRWLAQLPDNPAVGDTPAPRGCIRSSSSNATKAGDQRACPHRS